MAWLRTSLAFASIGIAVTQLFRLNTTISEREGYTPTNPDNTYHLRQVGKPLGATFLGIAILVLLIGGRRYFESQVCQRLWLENRDAILYARLYINLVLDYTRKIPRQQGQRLPHHIRRSRFDHHQPNHRLRCRSKCFREKIGKAQLSIVSGATEFLTYPLLQSLDLKVGAQHERPHGNRIGLNAPRLFCRSGLESSYLLGDRFDMIKPPSIATGIRDRSRGLILIIHDAKCALEWTNHESRITPNI